jgi:elongation factor G
MAAAAAASSYVTTDLRNVALVGHAGAGKTTLAEALLYRAGVLGSMGRVEKGDTVADFTDEEKQHGHSLFAATVHFDQAGKHVNLIDTPGLPDFMGQALGALPAVETVAVVINAAAGIESVTRRMMRRAAERNLCRMIVVNRIDAAGADLPQLVASIQEQFGKECLPINLSVDGGRSVVDCFFNEDEAETDLGSLAAAHTAIIDQVVEVDEELALAYLDGEKVSRQQIHDAFEKALRQGHVVPICFTSAAPAPAPGSAGRTTEPVGVDQLIDVLLRLAPNPAEGNPRPFVRGEDLEHEIHAQPDPDRHVLAHVFNVRIDPFVGKLAAFRVHQGRVTAQSQLYVDCEGNTTKKPIRVGHLFKLHGKKHVEIAAAIPGDLAAVAKIDEVHFDAVLHDSHDEDGIHLRPFTMPEPMSGLAITPKKRGDEQKIADALAKLVEEDPSLRVTREQATQQTVLRGLGDLHLRVVLEKLAHQYHAEVDTQPPRIAYRETVTVAAEGQHRHKKQTGGAGQFGEVKLRVEPLPRGEGFTFADETFGGSVPKQFMGPIEKGVRSAMDHGALAGYPIHDVKVTVLDGKHHPVDSKEIAFMTAGKKAFLDAFGKAKAVLLEPMVEVEVAVPSAQMGPVTGDLSGKRGRILGTDMLSGDRARIRAVVPLAEVANYQSQLKSVTGGVGSYTLEHAGYEPMPGHTQQQLVADYTPGHDDD